MDSYVHTEFDDDQHARAGVEALLEAGFDDHEIRLSQQHDGTEDPIPLRHRTQGALLGGTGAILGGVGGAVAGVLLALYDPQQVLLEGLDSMFSETPAIAGLEAGLLGAIMGGLLGTILGFGHGREVPATIRGGGGISVGVTTSEGRARRAIAALQAVSEHEVTVQHA